MKDQVIVITGASRGIGQATALTLARAGAQIVAVARSADGLAETRSLIESEGGRCHTISADVGSFDAVSQLMASTRSDFGRVDVLINNAGAAPVLNMQDCDVAVFDRMMAINCHAVFYACRAVWPIFIDQGGGRIVNISSVAAVDPFRGFQAYGASKAWVSTFTKALAEEGREYNILVHAVAPGAVDTRMLRDNFPDFPADQCLPPSEIASAVEWILDERSRHASGSVVYVKKS